MPQNSELSTTASYARTMLDEALLSPKGTEHIFKSEAEAFTVRHDCYKARKADRATNKKIYEKDDPKYGTSPYDIFVIKLRTIHDGTAVLTFHKQEFGPQPISSRELT